MPDVSGYDDKKKWMKVCVPKMIEEGKPQKQAVAACFSMWRNKKDSEEYEEFMAACVPVLERNGHTHEEAMMLCDEIFYNYMAYEEDYIYDWVLR